ncbi:MAG: hypothetical protein NXI27_31340 [Alphaproteobacteria bacterium]|nr:hypothetical protein [Alphaproteobacteria bacterium]
MDQEILVSEAQRLTQALDDTKIEPRAVLIAVSSETGNWKVWIVPKDDSINKQEFYRIVAEQISAMELKNIDVGSVELRSSTNAAIVGMSHLVRMDEIGSAHVSNNIINGILMPDGIVIRMAV